MTDLLTFELYGSLCGKDVGVLMLFCGCMYWAYFRIERNISGVKEKSWVIMLLSSLTLSAVGVAHALRVHVQSRWRDKPFHLNGDDPFSRSVLLFFVASNIMDLVIGSKHYPKQLDPLSTIFHHIFYIIFMSVLLCSGLMVRGFLLTFVMEVPTLVLALGRVWKSWRSDLAFGSTFIITRIAYNIWILYLCHDLFPEGYIWRVCSAVLGLHLYWFSKW